MNGSKMDKLLKCIHLDNEFLMRPSPNSVVTVFLDLPFTESHLQAIAKHKSGKSNYHLAWDSFMVGRDLNANSVQSDHLSIILKITRRKADGVHELVAALSLRLNLC